MLNYQRVASNFPNIYFFFGFISTKNILAAKVAVDPCQIQKWAGVYYKLQMQSQKWASARGTAGAGTGWLELGGTVPDAPKISWRCHRNAERAGEDVKMLDKRALHFCEGSFCMICSHISKLMEIVFVVPINDEHICKVWERLSFLWPSMPTWSVDSLRVVVSVDRSSPQRPPSHLIWFGRSSDCRAVTELRARRDVPYRFSRIGGSTFTFWIYIYIYTYIYNIYIYTYIYI